MESVILNTLLKTKQGQYRSDDRVKQTTLIAFLIGTVAGGMLTFLAQSGLRGPENNSRSAPLITPFMADPTAFSLSACNDQMRATAPCLLLQAGGKRLVFGTPLHTDWRGIGPLDAVLLFDGDPVSSAGVLGLRYETWLDGRPDRLLMVSGELFLDTMQAVDDALLVPDALIQMDAERRLDSRRAGFAVRPVPAQARQFSVFNTGDLQVFARSGFNDRGDQILSYRVRYEDQIVDLYSCEGQNEPFQDVSAHAIFIPAIDREELSQMQRRAAGEGLLARQREIRNAGLNCPSLTQARDFAQAQNAHRLVTLGSGHPDVTPNFAASEVDWHALEDGATEFERSVQD